MARDITIATPILATQRLRYGADASQFFDLFLPPPNSQRADLSVPGFAVMVHGGFWRAKYDLSHASHLCAALAAAGITTANLEYRRAGNGGGWPATLHDLCAALAAARQHFAAAPVVIGHSAGGHLALRLASDATDLKGVVALAPVADLRLAYDLHLSNDAVVEFLGGTPAERPAVYAAADAALHAAGVPRILIHGTHDDVVPIALSHSFIQKRRADGGKVELVELADATHFDLIDPASQAWPTVLTTVRGLLQG
ncbi:MAG: alpha/beta hydrolase [Candidatus Koribacter versatilis]|uniref:Alpha/beta hydrolase n=1 Tax=Candidatus Korobacter versatilis TaxID=658062 RepID=A0A932A702_9BACT|nr:alpha/beta hydrolase [Candidatus Koribacter versatilis]